MNKQAKPGGPDVVTGALVRPVGNDLRNAFFRVASITRNGWANCYCVAGADGTRTTPEFRSRPKFRISQLAVVEALPDEPAARLSQPVRQTVDPISLAKFRVLCAESELAKRRKAVVVADVDLLVARRHLEELLENNPGAEGKQAAAETREQGA